jgi:antitoxin HicB
MTVTFCETHEEALCAVPDALIAALGGYIAARRPIPPPSPAHPGQVMVALSVLVVAKLALYEAMQTATVTNAEIGRRLGLSEGAVRRLVDLDHRFHIGQVEAALAALGHRLVVDVNAA